MQGFSYLMARSFLVAYGVQPSQIGITPFNSALLMSGTASIALCVCITATTVFIICRAIVIRSRERDNYELEEVKKRAIRNLKQLEAADDTANLSPASRELDLRWLLANDAVKRHRDLVAKNTQAHSKASHYFRYGLMAIGGTIIILLILICNLVGSTIGKISRQADFGSRNFVVDYLLGDLAPRSVIVEWKNASARPLSLRLENKPDVYLGQLLGMGDGVTVVYLIDEGAVYLIPTGDLSLSTYVEKKYDPPSGSSPSLPPVGF
ncbi:MAG: hypothetical protein ACRDRL_25440 [Sciscionella sp.]